LCRKEIADRGIYAAEDEKTTVQQQQQQQQQQVEHITKGSSQYRRRW